MTQGIFCDTLNLKGCVWMLEHISSVKIINAGHRISVYKEHVKNRKYHAIFYKDQGVTRYEFGGQTHILNTDCAIYLPKGGTYYYENIGELEGKIFYVTFDCDALISDTPVFFDLKDFSEIRRLFVKAGQAFRFDGTTGKLDAYSYFYRLLAALERDMEISKNISSDVERIMPAVRHIQEHLFDNDLKISNLHERCGVSAPTFRKLFSSAYGCTPKKYVLNQRIQSAAEFLKSGECSSIAEVSAAVGFDDQLYFSKCFKQFYGVAPSVYKTK